ncbi:MAG: T9SS C-terminal target domain-containing protein [Chitinophagaceae bacterium]|nr:MAG: T9SS C-terminal target domain-containing protein [Chitinophagaceae bacterium]
MKNLMQTFGLILLLTFTFFTDKAHAWEIPGVPQQPQWFMPIMFEDATGQRDTVYLGYDSTYTMTGSGAFDPNFEILHHLDTSKFAVYWKMGLGWPEDSVKKIEISGYNKPSIYLQFNKGVYPIKMKWVDSLMYSDRLPYPEIEEGRPRARIDMECRGEPGYFPCGVGWGMPPYILSNYNHPDFNSEAWYPPYGLVHSDSLYFESSGMYLADNSVYEPRIELTLRPHNDPLAVNVEEITQQYLNIYPNPFESTFYVENQSGKSLVYTIYNVLGSKLLSGKLNDITNRITLSDYPAGVYWIRIHHENTHFTHKLLKL